MTGPVRRTMAANVVAVLVLAAAVDVRAGQADAPPDLPDFVGALVNFHRVGNRVAVCARDPAEQERRVGARSVAPTHVWVLEGDLVRQLGITTGSCDPVWSPDGQRLAVVQPNGLWTYSPTLEDPRQLAATHLPSTPKHESDYTAFANPRWSPDGRYVAFAVTNGATTWVEVVEVSNGRRVLKSAPGTREYRWEADRTVLVIDGRQTVVP